VAECFFAVEDYLVARLQGSFLRRRRSDARPLVHLNASNHLVANSRLVVFADLGHVPHEEDPAGTVAAVERFLRAE